MDKMESAWRRNWKCVKQRRIGTLKRPSPALNKSNIEHWDPKGTARPKQRRLFGRGPSVMVMPKISKLPWANGQKFDDDHRQNPNCPWSKLNEPVNSPRNMSILTTTIWKIPRCQCPVAMVIFRELGVIHKTEHASLSREDMSRP